MRYFFDTSVLLSCFIEDHEHHEASLATFLKADKEQGCCGAHSLAEFYATATRLPGKNRLSGEQVMLFLGNVQERLTVVTLTADEYNSVLNDGAAIGVIGGNIYDALLGRCAMKAEADFIYTWNVKHFRQISPEIARRTRTP